MLASFGIGCPPFFNYRQVQKHLSQRQKLTHENSKINIGTFFLQAVNISTMKNWLSYVEPGQYIRGHMPYSKVLSSILCESGFKHIFIIRDPRAVVASLIAFILDTKFEGNHHFLQQDLQALPQPQRLRFILEGGYASYAKVNIQPFINFCNEMFLWKEDPNCLFLKFEDLVGEKGGGDNHKQEQAMNQISSFLSIDQHYAKDKLSSVYDPNSPTFRVGKIDSWKTAMKTEEIEYLEEYSHDLCCQMGYKNFR